MRDSRIVPQGKIGRDRQPAWTSAASYAPYDDVAQHAGGRMNHRIVFAILAVCALALPVLAADMQANPYAGQQGRQIKALSDEDIAALRNGEGMGMAKAAELNGYPGPAHVLALAKQLKLTDDQVQKTQAIFDRMSAAAKLLGTEVIAREQDLDQVFVEGHVTPDRLTAETLALGELQGRLRSVHMTAHLEMRGLLTAEQIASYQQLRGYGDAAKPMQHHHDG
jgi:Spy/CpxP family protein refolding chaperone